MAKKYYAVAVGKKPDVYNNLDEAQKQASGIPNAVFKGFNTLEDARDYINTTRKSLGLNEINFKPKKEKIYVVLKGKKPGIYYNLEEVMEQVKGFTCSIFKKASSEDEARKLLENKEEITNKKEKIYVVVKGFNPGIYHSIEEVNEQIRGYTNPEIKSFKTIEDAESFANSFKIVTETTVISKKETFEIKKTKKNKKKNKKKDKKDKKKKNKKTKKAKKAIVYVDGSYNQFIKKAAYACVIITESSEEYLSGSIEDFNELHNVSGELKAAMRAMEYCVDKKIDKLTICYDFAGIETLCENIREESKDYIKSYKKYVRSISEKVDVSFKKIKAHSGDKYNEMADKLAKHALMLCS